MKLLGILAEHQEVGDPITIEAVKTAVEQLYGRWDALPQNSRSFIEDAFRKGDFRSLFASIREEEGVSANLLRNYIVEHPGVATQSNANEVLAALREKKKRSLLEQIQDSKDRQPGAAPNKCESVKENER